ncbi:MAG TPA: YpdA family putative bacillithiol disulfide reductase [Planctomycetota bacterium]|nr:YpdA family putative bacillithiol disulfide reductase [Planctomycetota bacterium]
MSDSDSKNQVHDLLVVGAGPTGIAIGAAAREAKLDVLLVDRGALTAAILAFPTYMTFFTTRDKLEIAGMPLTVPDEKPTRQQALVYYRSVVARYDIPLALHEKVGAIHKNGSVFDVHTVKEGVNATRRARAVAVATGYYDHPFKLCVPGADFNWVHSYYRDPYRHFSEEIALVGGGNSACEAALDMWRNGVKKVTMIVRDSRLKEGVKYWVRPDVENRIQEGAITAHFDTTVTAFKNDPRGVEARHASGRTLFVPCQAAYALIGFHPDDCLLRDAGVVVDRATLVPMVNADTCESNVPGLYIAGTVQAGLDTGRIFIENSRDHGPKIVNHLTTKLNTRT